MGALTPGQAIEVLWHMQVRLSRLLAIAFLWLIVVTLPLAGWLAWWAYGHLGTLAQMFGAVPQWLAGFLGFGGIVALLSGLYRAYQWLARKFLSHYLMHGLETRD